MRKLTISNVKVMSDTFEPRYYFCLDDKKTEVFHTKEMVNDFKNGAFGITGGIPTLIEMLLIQLKEKSSLTDEEYNTYAVQLEDML